MWCRAVAPASHVLSREFSARRSGDALRREPADAAAGRGRCVAGLRGAAAAGSLAIAAQLDDAVGRVD